ncbi:MAG: PTS glucose transporter subunit IIA [Ruminococcus sp.]|nr:PTS glucose transporter subunit IIA [Ruminococcus sp.]
MDYKETGIAVLKAVGGAKNVAAATHCATRLRFELVDDSIPDDEQVKKIPGVLNVVKKGGQYQVVIGPSVQVAYREIERNLSNNGKASKKETSNKDESLFNRILAKVQGIFTPMIPAITGAGMVKAILALCTALNLIDTSGQTYEILSFISDAAFYFMPVILAYTSSKVFDCNPVLAMTLAGVLLHPNFSAMVNAGDPIAFLGIPVKLVSYSGSVFPIILTVFVMSIIERLAEKYSPVWIKYILKPMLTILITAPLSLVILAPLGSFIGDGLNLVFNVLDGKAGWLVPFLMGIFTPLLVMFGMHTSLTPLATTQLATRGYEIIFGPGMLASNIAQGAAAMAITIKTKNKEFRQTTLSAGLTALMGITEPAMYGVTLRLKRPLIPIMIGGGAAGLFAGLSGLIRFAFGSPGIATLPCFIGENAPGNFMKALITVAIAFIVTFVLTLIIGWEDPKSEDETLESERENNVQVKKTSEGMTDVDIKEENIEISSPLNGKLIPITSVNDETFAQKILGDGVAIIPESGLLYAPISGQISIFDTKHAVGISGDNGIELLLHIGIDTVKLNGKYFKALVENGSHVKIGDKLIEFDIDAIKDAGYDVTTMIIVTGGNEAPLQIKTDRTVSAGDEIINIYKEEE